MAISLSLIPSGSLAAPACALVPQLRDVTINQGLGSYPKLVQGKETLVRAYLSLPSCASATTTMAIKDGTLTVSGGGLSNIVQHPFPTPTTPYPLISPNYRTTPPVDSPADPIFVIPGSYLDPTNPASYTATLSFTITYQVTVGTQVTNPPPVTLNKMPGTTAPITKVVERETHPLRVLVVPMGDARQPYASQYTAAGHAELQLAMQTLSRIYPVADGTGDLKSTTGGVRYTVLPTLLDIGNVLEPDGSGYCLRGSSFDVPIKGQLATFAQSWEAANVGDPSTTADDLQIDVAIGVVDASISKAGTCAQGLSVTGSSYTTAGGLAVVRLVPGQAGEIMAMEVAHALGLVPSGRGRAGDPSHSPNTGADAGSNRGYNLRERSFLADDRTALYFSSGANNLNTLLEQLDYAFLLCALGGSATTDCSNPGRIGDNVAAGPRFVLTGTVADDGLSANVVEAYSFEVPATPAVAGGPFVLRQLDTHGPNGTPIGPNVLRTDSVPVIFGGEHHGDGDHHLGTVDVAVPFNSDADLVEFRNDAAGVLLDDFVVTDDPIFDEFETVAAGDTNYTDDDTIDDESSSVSPDGQWVAWTTDPEDDLSRIQVAPITDAHDDAARELGPLPTGREVESQSDPAWSPDGGKLAFISNGDLLVADVDTDAGVPEFPNFLTIYDFDDEDGLETAHPTWSPDGAYIAFDAGGAIYRIPAEENSTGSQEQLTFTGDASHPTWSLDPDDSRIAYTREAPVGMGPPTLASYVRPEGTEPSAQADHVGVQFTVTTAADEGNPGQSCSGEAGCSLREAINAANSNLGKDSIHFTVGSGAVAIQPTSALPAIMDPVVIDGRTQPGFASAPIVELDGRLMAPADETGNGLFLGSGSDASVISALIINRFPEDGILILSSGSHVIEGNYIGTDSTGGGAAGNVLYGMSINSAGNLIGGDSPAERNVISGNGLDGVIINGPAGPNRVSGNYIGVDSTGETAVPNGQRGIVVNQAPNVTVGGLLDGEENVVSGNANVGISVQGSPTTIVGNLIGTDADGEAAIPNGPAGIQILSASNNTVGGSAPGAGNVISGNGALDGTGAGILINRFPSTASVGNAIQGNLIGTDATGDAPVGNGRFGILISGDGNTDNTIGGTEPGDANVIAYNGIDVDPLLVAAGVHIGGINSGNAIRNNSIHDNGGLGIDLGSDGVTPNDQGDADLGANDLQNFPVLTSATWDGANTTISGTLNGVAQSDYEIEIFANAACDSPGGHGEGATLVHAEAVLTDDNGEGAGDAPFNFTTSAASAGDVLTATATDLGGSTSEFSQCVTVSASPDTPSWEVNTTEDVVDGTGCTVGHCSLREAINRSNANVDVLDTIAFEIPGSAPHVIALGSALPSLVDPVIVDGTTQGGYADKPLVELDGSTLGADTDHGFYVPGGGTTIRGLALGGFGGVGIYLDGTDTASDENTIEDNYIGTDAATGTADRGVAFDGVLILRSSNNTISGNVISANGGNGITVRSGVFSDDNHIHENLIGTTADGQQPLGNAASGVLIDDALYTSVGPDNIIAANGGAGVEVQATDSQPNEIFGNYIGTNEAGDAGLGNAVGIHLNGAEFTRVGEDTVFTFGLNANVIAGNDGAGILVDSDSFANTIVANLIGVLPIGPDPLMLPNAGDGIRLAGATGTDIGGDNTDYQLGNLVGGNGASGIRLQDATDTSIEGNAIGTGVLGVSEIGNVGAGIEVSSGVSDTDIGGPSVGVANFIAFNGGDGISVDGSSSGVRILGNSIDQNTGLGIDLGNDGVTLNDAAALDADLGANGLQNFPIVSLAPDRESIDVRLNSAANQSYHVEVFVSPDHAGPEVEGDELLDARDISTDAFGFVSYHLDLDAGPIGETERISATATDSSGNTSEFSPCGQPAVDASDQVWTLDPATPACTQQLLVEDGRQPSWGAASEIAFVRAGDIWSVGSDGETETRITTGSESDRDPSFGPTLAFTRTIGDGIDVPIQREIFLMRDQIQVFASVTFDENSDEDHRKLDLIYSCPGSPKYDVKVALEPEDATGETETWMTNFDPVRVCPNGSLTVWAMDGWNRVSAPQAESVAAGDPPPVAAIYVPDVGTALLEHAGLALHGSGKDSPDGELVGSALRWFVGPTPMPADPTAFEVNYSACNLARTHCDIEPPGTSPNRKWPAGTSLTIRLVVTDSIGQAHTDEVTVPVVADGDNDGIPASAEGPCGSDANARDAYADTDQDGYLAQNDYALGGNPCIPATFYPANLVTFSPDTLYIPSTGTAVTVTVQLSLRDLKTVLRPPNGMNPVLKYISGVEVNIPNTGWTVDKNGVGVAKFDRQVVIRTLQSLGLVGRTAYYTITGSSTGGWSFEGTDAAEVKPAK